MYTIMKQLTALFLFTIIGGTLSSQTVLTMEKRGGISYIPCKINGLEKKFSIDTEATDAVISKSDVVYMLKNGRLKKEDVIETEYYKNTTDDITEGTKVIIRNVEIGGIMLHDVKASIVNTVDAPLLLNKDNLQKLGKYSVDYIAGSFILGDRINELPKTNAAPVDASYVLIGTQKWATKNLDVSKFRNGDSIMEVKTDEDWTYAYMQKKPAWCYYDNNPTNGTTYGKLYNYYAIKDKRELAPVGCHIPTIQEWNVLKKALSADTAAYKMKSTDGWVYYNGKSANGSNSSGFNCYPGGFRELSGYFDNTAGTTAVFWSWVQYAMTIPVISLNYNDSKMIQLNGEVGFGYSVRCIEGDR